MMAAPTATTSSPVTRLAGSRLPSRLLHDAVSTAAKTPDSGSSPTGFSPGRRGKEQPARTALGIFKIIHSQPADVVAPQADIF